MPAVIWFILIIMTNISDTDGLSRAKRLERFESSVVLPVLEERFPVLLAHVLCGSEFSSYYHWQPLMVWLDMVRFHDFDDAGQIYHVLREWRKRLEYACLEGPSLGLLKDISGQIDLHIRPVQVAVGEQPEDESVRRRFHLLLQGVVRWLQSRRETYLTEICTFGRMDPSLALLVAFLHNYAGIVSSFNLRWERLQDFYQKEILKGIARKRKPCSTWLSFEKSPAVNSVLLQRNIYFKAGKDEKVAGYKLLSDMCVTGMKVAGVSIIRVEKKSDRYPEAALGYVTSVLQSTLKDRTARPEPIGLRIHSMLLLLSEGEREVSVWFELNRESQQRWVGMVDEVAKAQEINPDEAAFKILNDSFLLKVSTSEGDREVDRFHLRWQEGIGLRLTFRLDESFPPVCPDKGEGAPALSLLMNTEAWLFPYSWARRLEVRSVRIHVKVNGLREFSLYNELGQVDARQPFSPFGIQGDKGAWMAFGCYEMALKLVTHVELHFRWLHLPVGNGGLEEHYREYNKGLNNRSFRARTEFLHNREWKQTSGIEEHYLFCTSSASVPIAADAVKEETKIVFEVPEVVLPPLDDITRFRLGEVRSGFYRRVLSAPDIGFGMHEYRRLFAEVMMENSYRRRKKRPLPEPPLSLQMDAVSLNYIAEEEVQFAVGCHSEIRFSYIRPLSGTVDATPDMSHPITLADGPDDEGNILIGIADAIGENIIRLYIGMELLRREIDHEYLPSVDWYYRDSYRWVKVDPVYVLRDDTGGLMHSGAVIIQFPFSISLEMTDTEGVFWICAGIHSNVCNCSVLRSVSLNVAEVAWTTEEETEKSVPGLLSYQRVGLLDTTAAEESETEMKARLSERIAHRQRPLLPCEYEQLVLQEFPGLAKVKCLRGIDAKSLNRATVVTLVAIRNRISKDWPLCTDQLLCRIESFLRPYTSPFAKIDAINPVYEEVTVFCGVSLKEGQQAGEAISDINRNLCRCIAPWNEEQKEPVLGYCFSIRDLISCIKENPSVEALHGIKLLQVIGEEAKFGLKEYTGEQDENQTIAPSVPWGILVPAVRQYVKLVEAGEWRQDIEFGDLEVENTFVIQ